MNEVCSLCDVAPAESKHHLVPKSRGGRETEGLCQPCHSQIHAIFTNKQLSLDLCSIEALKENEQIQRWINWRRKHPNVSVGHTPSKERRKRSKYH